MMGAFSGMAFCAVFEVAPLSVLTFMRAFSGTAIRFEFQNSNPFHPIAAPSLPRTPAATPVRRLTQIHPKLIKAAQQPINGRINSLRRGQREFSVRHSAVEAELSEMCESANRPEREL
jgi:hypothetical protein